MTLLSELVSGASGDTVPVATLLRQLKVIAARTEAAPLAEWVRHELDGYPSADDVPSYRGPLGAVVLGDFVGVANSQIRNFAIPPGTFPPEARDSGLFQLWLTQPVAELGQLATRESTLIVWPPDAVTAYNHGVRLGIIQGIVRDDMVLVQATRPVPAAVFVGVLDAVRTRVLDLALELEAAAPGAGQPDAPAETKAQAAQVVNYHFNGPATNVAIASTKVTQSVTVALPARGDEAALLRYLGAHGVDPSRLVELREALEHDRADAGGQHPPTAGARVKAWMATALTDLGTNAAGGVIGAALTAGLGAFFGG